MIYLQAELKGIKLHSRIIKGVEVAQFSHSCNLLSASFENARSASSS